MNEIREQGRAAFEAGLSENDNPYRDGTDCFYQWEWGWDRGFDTMYQEDKARLTP